MIQTHITKLLVLFLLAAIASSAIATTPTVRLSELIDGQVSLGKKLAYLEDPSHQLTLQNLTGQRDMAWQQSEAAVPNFGFSQSAYWFRVTIINDTPSPGNHLIEVANPVLDYLNLYVVAGERVTHEVFTGDQRPLSQRPIKHRNVLLPLQIPAGEARTVYFRASGEGAVQLPVDLWQTQRFYEKDQYSLAVQILFAGIMLALAVYNLFVLLVVREVSYVWYVLNVVTITIVQLALHGVTFQFLWPQAPRLNNLVLATTITLNVAFVLLFTYSFLNLRLRGRFLRWFTLSGAGLAFLLCATSLMVSYGTAMRLAVLMIAIAAPSALAIGIYLWARGDVLARVYTLAWSVLLLGHAMLVLNKMGILPRNVLFEYAPQFGAALEVLLFSFALAYRINLERQQRFQAQSDALASERRARSAQERALEVQREANEHLEARVKERTQELESANRRLEEMTAVDGLTQVKNRAFFDHHLAVEWRRNARARHNLSLLLLDADHFKNINDTYGHLGGDACLKHLAQLLRDSLNRPGDFVARYGGEEFAILLCHTDLEGACVVAERVRHKVESTPLHWEGQTIYLTASIGVASIIPQPDQDMKGLVKQADDALYAAKKAGRNRIRTSSEESARPSVR
ncbi:sensor domain-containing diguanylate cyclase [Marinobacter arenosus]|uniref:sensor domain-containing diguanylate cyclase n=1 Tax=Marinobacter arenosus TaxID=2856822 RepID=UPI001C4A9613|nr:diguanylate cyclase [Marinobacter arenosus]MBW0148954.1 diguanylate cyclase [Marinobacter arenosus]